MNLFKRFAIAYLTFVLLSLAAATEHQPWEAGGFDVDVVTSSRHLEPHPSTTQHNLDVVRGGRPKDLQDEVPSSLRGGHLRLLQEEKPSWLHVQMADKCIFQTTENGNMVMKSRHFHDQTVMFSDRPFTFEKNVPTEEFFDNFYNYFNASNGGMPNAAITLVQNDESKDVVVSVFVKAVVNRREDPDGPTYVYKLEQSDEQSSVTPLSDIMGGEDKMVYDHCSIFVDGFREPWTCIWTPTCNCGCSCDDDGLPIPCIP